MVKQNHKEVDMNQLLAVVRLYYEQDKTQQEIGKMFGVTGKTIGQWLLRARQEGIIRFHIVAPPLNELGALLRKRFPGLLDALVVPSSDDFLFERGLCSQAAAQYFDDMIDSKALRSVALGGGNTIYGMVDALPKRDRSIEIYPTAIIGRGPNIVLPDRTVIISLLWSKSGEKTATAHYASVLPPENLSSIEQLHKEQAGFLKRKIVRTVYDGMLAVDCVFTTLGIVGEHPEYKHLSPQTTVKRLAAMGIMQGLREKGAIGEVSYGFFDADGNPRPEWNFAIAVGVDSLKQMTAEGRKVVVVAGRYKEKVIEAALKGKMFNVLVTDERTARQLLTSE